MSAAQQAKRADVLSNAARQDGFRQRQAQKGLTEVRGVYARPEDHAGIKAYAKGLLPAANPDSKA